ncbi:dihydropteroate synthase [Phaffia rhodozyma]|uniref:Folic acid synthesis protein FOL1 n=1 Tax=Phaffia rhodozyma TaxID=264483 RepID=A0A0F7SKC3_PHARH|nr:dihydropteroate synthase [Phaffia rhodozyma]
MSSTNKPDEIVITDLVFPLLLASGDHWHRPTNPSPHSLSFTITHPLIASALTDNVSQTLSYSDAAKAALSLAHSKTWESIEGCAEGIADELVRMNNGGQVKVRLECLKNLAGGKVGVEMVRGGSKLAKSSEKESKIWIKEVEVRCIIGVNPQERLEKQAVVIDLEIPLTSNEGKSSQSSAGFPHRVFANAIHDYVQPTSYQTIESLSQTLSAHLFSIPLPSYPPIPSLTLRVSKPYAVTFAKYASVEITRQRSSVLSSSTVLDHTDDEGNALKSHTAVLAVGSNIGDRMGNISKAIKWLLRDEGNFRLVDTSFLYESEPMYVEDQDRFLNGAIIIETLLGPEKLLSYLKAIESGVGRTQTFRNGPRVVDLDLIFYDDQVIDVETPEGGLIVPHPRLGEREFVLRPLIDMIPDFIHPSYSVSISALYQALPPSFPPCLNRVIPFHHPISLLPSHLSSDCPQTQIMSILNLTPDSFSDGGSYPTTSVALETARSMIESGATILDIGGLSTRPGAEAVSEEIELDRVVPLIQALRSEGITIPISVDTYRPSVARGAMEAGASMINDVHAGRAEGMWDVMAESDAPVVLMHSRGDSQTMSSLTDYPNGVVQDVRMELAQVVEQAIKAGVKRWNIILDPGIGFAKTAEQNWKLLAGLEDLVREGNVSGGKERNPIAGYPLLVGASRKGFIGALTGRTDPKDRGYGSAAVVARCVASGVVQVVRVHDTRETKDLVLVLEAIESARRGKSV